jgi:hypothetical protein
MSVHPDDIPITAEFQIVQLFIVLVVLFTLYIEIRWIINQRSKWMYGLPILILMIHALLYYFVVFSAVLNLVSIVDSTVLFTDWSVILRLHGYITICSIEYIRFRYTKRHLQR